MAQDANGCLVWGIRTIYAKERKREDEVIKMTVGLLMCASYWFGVYMGYRWCKKSTGDEGKERGK
jgi:hypothetical protein